MKKTKKIATRLQEENKKMEKKIDKKKENLNFKVGDPNKLNFYW